MNTTAGIEIDLILKLVKLLERMQVDLGLRPIPNVFSFSGHDNRNLGSI